MARPIQMLRDGVKAGTLQLSNSADLEECILPNLKRVLGSFVPTIHDHRGFESSCRFAEIAWVKVRYLKWWVSTQDETPFPRRQELPRGSFYFCLPPDRCRRYVLSHAWDCQSHPSPSGGTYKRLMAILDADGASMDDGIFLDYSSLNQRARELPATLRPLREWTVAERRQFSFAINEISRLYAFKKCRVVVVPQVDAVDSTRGIWGRDNQTPYSQRGWCVMEFSCALYANTIINLKDAAVQEVLRSRDWPRTVEDYQTMMDGTDVRFTSTQQDANYVAYVFNKMCIDPRLDALPPKLQHRAATASKSGQNWRLAVPNIDPSYDSAVPGP